MMCLWFVAAPRRLMERGTEVGYDPQRARRHMLPHEALYTQDLRAQPATCGLAVDLDETNGADEWGRGLSGLESRVIGLALCKASAPSDVCEFVAGHLRQVLDFWYCTKYEKCELVNIDVVDAVSAHEAKSMFSDKPFRANVWKADPSFVQPLC